MQSTGTGSYLRVGELAEASGLTIRALHHYEQIGLLSPAFRTGAGHRMYGQAAVARLYSLIRLRRLGMSLNQISHALDDPDWSLADALRQHLASVDAQLAGLAALRNGVSAALAHLELDGASPPDLLEIVSTMDSLESQIRRRISIMVYRNLQPAYDYLTKVFGFSPGDITIGADGRAVHAEVFVGDGVIWLHPETQNYRLASPSTLGAATASMAVLVDDVDGHFNMVSGNGASIVYEPIDQPYGYREYSARDCEGAIWSFMKELTP
jgi:MerR family transcriptional regulator, thiopeptide resistance regulator